MAKKKKKTTNLNPTIATNRKARHDYNILETYECGMVLVGTEVKSLREGKASLVDAFATIDEGEVWLRNLHIPEYSRGHWTNHSPRRVRKLLLHRREIDTLTGKVRDGNKTLEGNNRLTSRVIMTELVGKMHIPPTSTRGRFRFRLRTLRQGKRAGAG